jgi:hypothetical protein
VFGAGLDAWRDPDHFSVSLVLLHCLLLSLQPVFTRLQQQAGGAAQTWILSCPSARVNFGNTSARPQLLSFFAKAAAAATAAAAAAAAAAPQSPLHPIHVDSH